MKDKQTKSGTTALNLVLKCGIPPTLKGHKYLAEAVELHSSDNLSYCDIYRHIAGNNNVKPKSVMRDMSYAINQSMDLIKNMSELMDIPIPPEQMYPSLVISYLAFKLESMRQEENAED